MLGTRFFNTLCKKVIVVCFLLLCLCAFLIVKCKRQSRTINNKGYESLMQYEELLVPKTLDLEKAKKSSLKDTALLRCHLFLRCSGKYSLVKKIPDSDDSDRHCFELQLTHLLVDYPDVSLYSPCLLSIQEETLDMVLPFTNTARLQLYELLKKLALYPFLMPVLDVEFMNEQRCVATVQIKSDTGSLADLIRESKCSRGNNNGKSPQDKAIGRALIKVYGKQILAALIFLESKNFPSLKGHLHSGNVIFAENGCCQLSGYEGVLLGRRGKLCIKIQRLLSRGHYATESVSFGYLLYEMATGEELSSLFPDENQLNNISDIQVKMIIEFVFGGQGRNIPSLAQISDHPFFNGVALRELKKLNISKIHLTSDMKLLLKSVRKDRLYIRQKSSRSITNSGIFSDNLKTTPEAQHERTQEVKVSPKVPVISKYERQPSIQRYYQTTEVAPWKPTPKHKTIRNTTHQQKPKHPQKSAKITGGLDNRKVDLGNATASRVIQDNQERKSEKKIYEMTVDNVVRNRYSYMNTETIDQLCKTSGRTSLLQEIRQHGLGSRKKSNNL